MRVRSDPIHARAVGGAAIVVAVLFAMPPCLAVDYFLATDVPAHLGTADYTPDQFVLSKSAVYSLAASLPAGLQVGALHRRSNGSWLFSPAHPVMLGGTDYEPRDVVAYDGATFSSFFDGSVAGIPAEARIDALWVDSESGAVVFSFDVPVRLGTTEYAPVDLVGFASGTFSMDWNGAAAGVPPDANVVGYAKDLAGHRVITLDVPSLLGGTNYLPGDLVQWDSGSFSLYFRDASWPREAQLRDVSFLPPAGEVPQDADAPGGPLKVDKATGSDISLSWSRSCRNDDTDYEVYEGSVDAGFANHSPKLCSTGGALSAIVTPSTQSSYYLVAPRNAVSEGSHGHRSDGKERVGSLLRCLPQAAARCSIGRRKTSATFTRRLLSG